jgi:O-antigen/teichoic acid export membrane protein
LQAANRVIFNTGIVYARLIFSLLVGLVTTRIILNALGETDYGIYSLVAGVIGTLSFLNASMANASMRFMSHSLGSGDSELVKRTFNTSLIIHFFLGFVVVLIMEIGGLLMFKYWLNIPPDRLYDAKVIFHFMVITTFVSVISVPFDAVMNAHENFLAISLIAMFGISVGLGIAFYISYIDSNQLIIYGFLVLLNQIMIRIIKQVYSRINYVECKIRLKDYIDKVLIRNILSFASWSMLGVSSGIIITQSKSILLNMFFGVNLNAANGIANNLTSQLNNFSASMTQAINPQIMKSEGGGNRDQMIRLTTMAAKFSVFLFAIFSIPVFIETPYLLWLWLENVPDFVVIFTRLMILTMIIEKFTFPITTAISAIGRIKEITIVGLIAISLTIPIAYFLFKAGMPPQTIYLVGIFISLLSAGVRLYYGKKIAGINIGSFLKTVVLKSSVPIILAAGFTILPFLFLNESFIRLVLTTGISIVASVVLIRYIGLTKEEFLRLKGIVQSLLVKLKLKKK